MNFGEIKGRVRAYIGSDTGPLVDDWVRDGQKYLERELKIRPMEYFPVQATLASGTNSIVVPSDYLELLFLNLIVDGLRISLSDRYQPKEFVETFSNVSATIGNGRPSYFARMGSNFIFDKYADKDYSYEWAYFRSLSTLSNDADTNWWTTDASSVLIYASLVEALPFVKKAVGEEWKVDLWQRKRVEEKERLRLEYIKEMLSGGNLNGTRYV